MTKDEIDGLIRGLSERALALGRAKQPSKAIDDLGAHLMRSAAALEAQRAEIERLRTALKPFHNAVFNDNGDVTVTPCSVDEYFGAYAAYRK